MAKKYEMDMTSGALLPKIIRFAIPLMLSSLLQLLYNAADIVVVGRFVGDTALAAVGSTGPMISLIINVFMGLSVGTGVTMAQSYGAGDEARMEKVVHTSIALGLCGGLILTFAGIALTRPLLQLMGSPVDVIDQATLYIRIYFCGVLGNLTYNYGAAVLRSVGDTRRPMYILMATGVVNVILNVILVLVFHMGVAGVGIATITAQFLSCIAVLVLLMRAPGSIRFSWRKLRIDPGVMLQILKIGLPAGLQGTIFSISNVLIQSSINSFGSAVVAGDSAASNLEAFVYVAMNAFYQAALTFTGQNLGAGKLKRIPRILFCCAGAVFALGILMGGGFWLFGKYLLRIYSSNADVIAAGLVRMSYLVLPYFLCGLMDLMVSALRGLGASTIPMLVSIVGVCGVRILWIYTVFQQFHTPEVLYLSYPISWSITAAIHIVSYVIVYRRFLRERSVPTAS